MDWVDWLLVGIVCLIVYIVIVGIINANLYAEASERAKEYCQFQGYNSYYDFHTTLFSSKPYGIRCENPAYRIEGNGTLIIQNIGD